MLLIPFLILDFLGFPKVLIQGKFFQRCTHILYCSVLSLGGKVNTRRMSKPDMESIFTKIIYEIFWSKETIMWIFKFIKIKCFYPPRILDEHWCIYSCLQSPPRENRFQNVLRVYATAINFPPFISTFGFPDFLYFYSLHLSVKKQRCLIS